MSPWVNGLCCSHGENSSSRDTAYRSARYDVARMSGVARSTVSKLMVGRRETISVSHEWQTFTSQLYDKTDFHP